jgi:hypothetical protein
MSSGEVKSFRIEDFLSTLPLLDTFSELKSPRLAVKLNNALIFGFTEILGILLRITCGSVHHELLFSFYLMRRVTDSPFLFVLLINFVDLLQFFEFFIFLGC